MEGLMKRNLSIYICFIFCATLSSCGHKKDEKKEAVVKKTSVLLTADQFAHIRVDTATMTPEADALSAVGNVSFSEDNVVRIYPIVSGTVEKVNVSLGDYVQKGQILSTLLSTDMSAYQRDYNVAKSNFEVEEKNLARSKDLFQSGMMSEKEYASSQKDYSNSLSEYNERKQILALYGGSPNDLDALYKVRAPREGYIVERNITEGTQIRNDNGTNIFTISDLKNVWVWINVHESDLAKISEGDAVKVQTIAYPDKVFNGTVKKIGTMLDPASRVIRMRTELANSEGLLKPEMFATVTIIPKTKKNVLVVDQLSVVLENNRYFVMRETAPMQFEKVAIELGKIFGNYYEVKSGLAAGDKIVGEGSLFVLTAYNQL
jgi:membrane fusion protein, heavy metal efflux system